MAVLSALRKHGIRPPRRTAPAVALFLFFVLPLVRLGAAPPVVPANGIINGADYSRDLSPGAMVAIFGTDLASGLHQATAFPLPAELAGVQVEIVDGARTLRGPLFFVSPGQINFQMPFGITAARVTVRVRTPGGASADVSVPLLPRSPRLLTKTMDGRGEALVVHQDYTLASKESPAKAGEWVSLYLVGLGEVRPAIDAGQRAGDGATLGPLREVTESVEVLLDGIPCSIYLTAMLAPGWAGLYQVNFKVPDGITSGLKTIQVRQGDRVSQGDVHVWCQGRSAGAEPILEALRGANSYSIMIGFKFSFRDPSDTQDRFHNSYGPLFTPDAASAPPVWDEMRFASKGSFEYGDKYTFDVQGEPNSTGRTLLWLKAKLRREGGGITEEFEITANNLPLDDARTDLPRMLTYVVNRDIGKYVTLVNYTVAFYDPQLKRNIFRVLTSVNYNDSGGNAPTFFIVFQKR
jgi:uncharacterized protein (TIGR03437 family)